MLCMISFENHYAVIGWSIISFTVLIGLTIALVIISRLLAKKQVKLDIAGNSVELSGNGTEPTKEYVDIKKDDDDDGFKRRFFVDALLEKRDRLKIIPFECLKEQMNVVRRCNTVMNLQMKEHYKNMTGYAEGSFQWKYYCLCLLELVKQGGFDFCERFLIENHVAEKSDDAYRIYCEQKKDEGWNIAKDIISSYYDDTLLTLNRIEYFQKASQGLRIIYDKQMENIFDEVRNIALKYQKESEDLKIGMDNDIDNIISQ